MSRTIAVANTQSEDELASEYDAIAKTVQHTIDDARSGSGDDMRPAVTAAPWFQWMRETPGGREIDV